MCVFLAILSLPFFSIVGEAIPIETKEFSDINIFYSDGFVSHYYVELYNTSLTGEVYIYHPEDSFDFTVETTNIKVLIVDVQSLYNDEAGDVWVSLPSDFREWVTSHIGYNITLSTDGNLSMIGITNGENLDPMGILWNGDEIEYSRPDPGTFTVELPEHGTEDNTIRVYYEIHFPSTEFNNILFNIMVFIFIFVPIISIFILTFKEQIVDRFQK